MNDSNPATALLILLTTRPGSTAYTVPFNSGLTTTKANVAVFLHGSYGAWVDLADPANVHTLPAGSVATNASGYNNAIEAELPASLLGGNTHGVSVAVASGIADSTGTKLQTLPLQPNVANVAFRTQEPARNWWDKQQALELQKGTIDSFFVTADLDRMAAGANQRYVPRTGYYDRIFTSTADISHEGGMDGILQHYGVYLPSGYVAGRRTPTQYWFHFRGGDAHIAAAVVPGVIWDMGEHEHSIVVTPDGRGDSGWYVGRSQEDVLQVWADSHRLFSIDPNRTYIAGHSMGGWASYLLPIEHPDWFAAAFPASGPVTQGAYTGADVPGCDSLQFQDYTPCFIQANGGDARAEYTYPLLDNLKWVPYAIYQGTNDELVPTSGVTLNVKRFQELGYRYRYYLFPGQEHYGPPIVDQWVDGADYEHRFVRNPNPPEVTYIRSMVFEHAINTVNSGGVHFDFALDHAYWMSGLTPVDATKGVAKFDGRSLAITDPARTSLPETGPPAGPEQGYPYAMVGQQWSLGSGGPTSNAFQATLDGRERGHASHGTDADQRQTPHCRTGEYRLGACTHAGRQLAELAGGPRRREVSGVPTERQRDRAEPPHGAARDLDQPGVGGRRGGPGLAAGAAGRGVAACSAAPAALLPRHRRHVQIARCALRAKPLGASESESVLLDPLKDWIGYEHLAALGGVGDARRNVHVYAQVIPAELSRSAPVHTRSHLRRVVAEADLADGLLSGERGVQRSLRREESGHHAIPQALDNPPAVRHHRALHRFAHLTQELYRGCVTGLQRP